MPGTKITDEDRKTIGRKFICTSCNLLLSSPMQTHCGHLMCSSCVDTMLEYVILYYCSILLDYTAKTVFVSYLNIPLCSAFFAAYICHCSRNFSPLRFHVFMQGK